MVMGPANHFYAFFASITKAHHPLSSKAFLGFNGTVHTPFSLSLK